MPFLKAPRFVRQYRQGHNKRIPAHEYENKLIHKHTRSPNTLAFGLQIFEKNKNAREI